MTKQVIVIDDSETVRRQVSAALTPSGYEVIHASDGVEGHEQVQAHQTAALAICDINMPRLGGLDLLERLRTSLPAHMPFVMLTTEGAPELIERAVQLGAKGWIVKPFKPDLLLAVVKKLAGGAA